MLLYVDDILISSNWPSKKQFIINTLKDSYQIKELGPVDNFLGMKICQEEDGKVFIGQEKYIENIISRFNLQHTRKRSTPLDKNERFQANDQPVIANKEYRPL